MHTRTDIHTYTHTSYNVCAQLYVYTFTCIHMCMYINIHTYEYIHILRTCVGRAIYIYIHITARVTPCWPTTLGARVRGGTRSTTASLGTWPATGRRTASFGAGIWPGGGPGSTPRARAAHQRFGRPNRWEAALEVWYGQCQARNPAHGRGWMAKAQDREAWKQHEVGFVRQRGLPPASLPLPV